MVEDRRTLCGRRRWSCLYTNRSQGANPYLLTSRSPGSDRHVVGTSWTTLLVLHRDEVGQERERFLPHDTRTPSPAHGLRQGGEGSGTLSSVRTDDVEEHSRPRALSGCPPFALRTSTPLSDPPVFFSVIRVFGIKPGGGSERLHAPQPHPH